MIAVKKIKVWDSFVRVFHWSLLISVVLAFITAHKGMQDAHAYLGYFICFALLMRILWGFIGSNYARFASFTYSLPESFRYVVSIVKGRPAHYIGHNPAGGAMVFALLLTLCLLCFSGLFLLAQKEYESPLATYIFGFSDATVYLWDGLHWFLGNFALIILALCHVLGVMTASLQHRENLVAAMITGFKSFHDNHKVE